MYRKNTAGQFIHFQGVDSTTGGIKSGVTWTVRRCIDGTFAAATGTVTEDGTTGWYKFAMSQADTNGNNVGFNFTGTGAIPQTVNIVTTVLDPTSAAFGLSIAKTTNITGFNDIAATAVVSAGAITTSGGAVSTVSAVTGLTPATVHADLDDIQTRLPAALVSGRIDASVGAMAANVITATAINADAITDAKVAADVTIASVAGSVGSVTGSVGSVVGLTASNLDTTVSSRATPAQVNTEVVDALNVDTYAEPGQGAPAATTTLVQKIGFLYKAFRNRKRQTATLWELLADDEATVDQKATVSDDATTAIKQEIVSGP